MGTPFIAEMRIMAFTVIPRGWALCNGQLLPINQNQPLFSLLGTTYGGDGRTTFGLPDCRGRVPVHTGTKVLGERGGEEFHTVSSAEMPAHTHFGQVQSGNGSTGTPNNGVLAGVPTFAYRNVLSNLTTLQPGTIANTGGSQAHENRQPFLVLNFMIALQGTFPSRN